MVNPILFYFYQFIYFQHQLDERKIFQQNFSTKIHFAPDYTIENPKIFESTKKAYLPSGDLREEIIDSTKLHPSSDESTEEQKHLEPTKNHLNSDDIREEQKMLSQQNILLHVIS